MYLLLYIYNTTPVQTGWDQLIAGLNHNRLGLVIRPEKDRKNCTGPVYTGSVRFFVVFDHRKTGLGLGPGLEGPKTGPDRTSKHYTFGVHYLLWAFLVDSALLKAIFHYTYTYSQFLYFQQISATFQKIHKTFREVPWLLGE